MEQEIQTQISVIIAITTIDFIEDVIVQGIKKYYNKFQKKLRNRYDMNKLKKREFHFGNTQSLENTKRQQLLQLNTIKRVTFEPIHRSLVNKEYVAELTAEILLEAKKKQLNSTINKNMVLYRRKQSTKSSTDNDSQSNDFLDDFDFHRSDDNDEDYNNNNDINNDESIKTINNNNPTTNLTSKKNRNKTLLKRKGPNLLLHPIITGTNSYQDITSMIYLDKLMTIDLCGQQLGDIKINQLMDSVTELYRYQLKSLILTGKDILCCCRFIVI